jgi:alpha-2-macroglobulin
MKRLIIIVFLALTFPVSGQNLLSSRSSGYNCYIFRITDSEAGKIMRSGNNKWMKDEKYFHSLIDSFPLYTNYKGKLQPGHYLVASVNKNEFEITVRSVLNVNVQVVKNNTDLCVQVYDTKGTLIKNAVVRAASKKLSYDNEVKGFLLAKTSVKGVLEIKYNGVTSLFDLNRLYNRSLIRSFESRFLTGTPLKYIWVPAKFIVAGPLMTARDLINGNSYSIGNDLLYYWRRNGLFTRSYGGAQKNGYFVFNKPIYLPGDTVKFKAFLVNSHGRPLERELQPLVIKSWDDKIKLPLIRPSLPGNYSGRFVLADSLGLDLDKHYNLDLVKGRKKTFATGNFRYEDYELKNMFLVVRPDSDVQARGKVFNVHIRATDENDLNIQDGRIELLMKSGAVTAQYRKNVFLPDTLFKLNEKLLQSGETVLAIPDSSFPEANFSYKLQIKVIRSDNEYKSFDKTISYQNHSKEISYSLDEDSILFVMKEDARIIKTAAKISGIDKFGYVSPDREVILPFREKIDPFFESYRITAQNISRLIHVEDNSSLISCESSRINDSLKVKILNPRNIPFTWFLYRGNRLEKKGYGNELAFKQKINRNRKYNLSLVYLWSGSTRDETYDLSGNVNELNINVDQPALVYPGKKVMMTATVTDYSGKPVEGVDLTAFSYTSKFRSDPRPPYSFPDIRKSKKLYNNFRIDNPVSKENLKSVLDYGRWKKTFSLDTIEYYRFFNHNDEILSYTFPAPDSITQFAPFIVKNGAPVAINIIYVDRVPVYFSWTKNDHQPYSFRVDSGYHFVEIRTRDKRFMIDSVYFRKGKKLILSINALEKPQSYKIINEKPSIEDNEKYTVARYLFPYRNNFREDFAYMVSGGNLSLLNFPSEKTFSAGYGYNYFPGINNLNVVGPLRPGSLILKIPGNYNLSFIDEDNFEFEFEPSLIKMREMDKKKLVPRYFWNSPIVDFSGSPLSEKRILRSYDDYLFQKKIASARFDLPKSTLPEYGELNLTVDSVSATGQPPLFILLMSEDTQGRVKVYPGNCSVMKNLYPGLWSVVLFYRGDSYSRYDSIPVFKGGSNYSHLGKPGIPVYDSLSKKLNSIIEDQVYHVNTQLLAEFQNYVRQSQRQVALTKYSGEGVFVSGTVKDKDEAIPGVTVMVKGTSIGTITDLNGYYSLVVPYENKELVFSFIGYRSLELPVSSEIVNASLEEEVMALNEVVVVGYGIQRRSMLTGSIAGIAASPGSAEQIRIRGASSINAGNSPLFVIDGVPYRGDISDLDPQMLKSIKVLKDESLTSIYGARAANGVVMISTAGLNLKNTKFKSFLKGAAYDSTFMQEASAASSVRTNFSDYAYWKPDLVSDKNGKASFSVKFSDDVTSWSSYVMAMNGKKQSGMYSGKIKSYKPLLAQLYTPRFLIEGDSANLIGKVQNYSGDTIPVNVHYELNDKTVFMKNESCINSFVDTLPLIASSPDTLKAKYFFERSDGYLDGELRKIPVYRKGLELTSGKFFVLNGDTAINISFNPKMRKGELFAQTDRLDVLTYEISGLISYSYECNEQLASKLYALLAMETISRYKDKPFTKKVLVNRIIRGLEKNQNQDGCWGWWDRSETSIWVTAHVLAALSKAKQSGYNVRLNYQSLKDYIIWKLESKSDSRVSLDLLYLMSGTGEKIDYNKYISGIKEADLKTLEYKFKMIELKQRLGLVYSVDSVLKYQKTTMFGNIYFDKPNENYPFWYNEIQASLAAYRILKKDDPGNSSRLERIRNYLFERRRLGKWQNTLESASIIETILPDVLHEGKGKNIKPVLILSGAVSKTITEFPFEMTSAADDSIHISKKGSFPVYLTSYQHYWKTDPSEDSIYFKISTSLGMGSGVLKAGKPVKMTVSVNVKKDAQYVMIEVPIPAGCSYESKNTSFSHSCHTEFFRDHLALFAESLKPGKYSFDIDLLPRYSGSYTLNPAKIELMYFPVFSSNNSLKSCIIK